MLESLPVELNIKHPATAHSTPHKERTRLGDIASVVPKGGRTMQVFAAEEAHVKPLIAALHASDYSLAPEPPKPDDPNPLCIVVPVPPVTAETRAAAVAKAKECLDKAQLEVRNARGDAQKRHRKMEKDKLVIVDELRKAHKSMEEVAKKGADKAKSVHDAAVKALER
jgi:ribosome recycling factor